VTWQPGESTRSFYLRAFRYWTSVCTLAALVLGLAWLETDVMAHPYAEGFFYFLAPIVIGVGYLQAAINLAQYAWQRRIDARRPPPPPHRPLF
jgi:chromate transport protein ChrA